MTFTFKASDGETVAVAIPFKGIVRHPIHTWKVVMWCRDVSKLNPGARKAAVDMLVTTWKWRYVEHRAGE